MNMTLFSRIKKVLEVENACVISKNKNPLFVVLRWETYQKMVNSMEDALKIKGILEEEQSDGEYDIDINKIPV